MSQADANSMEGDTRDKPTTTGTGCYKNYDHNMFSRAKKFNKKSVANDELDENLDLELNSVIEFVFV